MVVNLASTPDPRKNVHLWDDKWNHEFNLSLTRGNSREREENFVPTRGNFVK